MRIGPELLRRFDELLQEVLDDLPEELQKYFEEIPIVVEDAPSQRLLRELHVPRGVTLQGLHTGIPLTRRSVEHSGVLPTVITIFRHGILDAAADDEGMVTDDALYDEIRITVLHELGHHLGMDEEDLEEYGYG